MAAEVANLQETSLSIEELEAEIAAENERRYAYYRMLNATDRVLWRLEELNKEGVKRISVEAWGRLYATLSDLPEDCRAVLADPPGVQALLDSVFDAQERLFRWRDPGREIEPDVVVDYTAADLVAWGALCQALDEQPDGITKGSVAQEHIAALEAMHDHQVVFLRGGTRWRAHANWPARLERLRAALAAGEGG